MQGRTRGTSRPSEEVGDDGVLSDGFVARLADHIFENPAMSGGLFVMALTAAAIVSNAMMMQNGHHPDPLFMTRPGVASRAPVPLPRTRVGEPAKPPVPVPAPRQAPAAQPAATPVAAAAADEKVIADVQRALAGRRLYRGAADGIAGPHTRAAIAAYERSAGLPVTGTASADLLARLRAPAKQLAAVKPVLPAAKVAAPPAAAAPAVPATGSAVQTGAAATSAALPAPARQAIEAISATPEAAAPAPAASSPEAAPAVVARQAAEPVTTPPVAPAPTAADVAPDSGAVDEAVPSAPEAAAPAPPPPPAAAPAASAAPAAVTAPVVVAPVAAAPVADAPPPPPPDASNGDRQRYRKIQNALNQAGYGPLKADGMASEQTTSAIRRFELDNGLPITGKPSDRVTARLVSIGALDAN